MNSETKSILAQMGFNVSSVLTIGKLSRSLGLDLTIKRNGNGSVVFCNGGRSEYDLLSNHGAVRRFKGSDYDADPEIKSVGNGIPYLTLSMDRLLSVFTSIARMRVLHSGNKRLIRAHQRAARRLAKHWIAMLPSEQNELYARDLACDQFEAELEAETESSN